MIILFVYFDQSLCAGYSKGCLKFAIYVMVEPMAQGFCANWFDKCLYMWMWHDVTVGTLGCPSG